MFHLALMVVPWSSWLVSVLLSVMMLGFLCLVYQGMGGVQTPWVFITGLLLFMLGVGSAFAIQKMQYTVVPAPYLQRQSGVVKAALQADLAKTHEPLTVKRMVDIEARLLIVRAQLDATNQPD